MMIVEKLTGTDFFRKPGMQAKLFINTTLFNNRELLRNPLYGNLLKYTDRRIAKYKKQEVLTIGNEVAWLNISSLKHTDTLFKKIANTLKSCMPFIIHGIASQDPIILMRLNNVLVACRALNSAIIDVDKSLAKKDIGVPVIHQYVNSMLNLHTHVLILHALRITNTFGEDRNDDVYSIYSKLCYIHQESKQFLANYKLSGRQVLKNTSIADKLVDNTVTRNLSKIINSLWLNKELVTDIDIHKPNSYILHMDVLTDLSGYTKAIMLFLEYSNKGIWRINSSTHGCAAKSMSEIAVLNVVLSGLSKLIDGYIKGQNHDE